jgi:hypothetical protein
MRLLCRLMGSVNTITLEKSAGPEITIGSLANGTPVGSVGSVMLLGGLSLRYKQDATGLAVSLPDARSVRRPLYRRSQA